MPSTPPPLPYSHLGLSLIPVGQASCLPPPAEPNRIHWPAILAAAFLSSALVAGAFAWIASHPHKVAPSCRAIRVTTVESPTTPPTPAQTNPFAELARFPRSSEREAISNKIPLLEEDPPYLPPPSLPPSKQREADHPGWVPLLQQPPLSKQPARETYGTQVLFFNNREAAADLARREHKLLFVIHISGNFEDSCFT